MNSFNESNYSEYIDHNMALSDNQGTEQQMALMECSENPRHSTAGKGDSALTAFLRSNKKQNTLSGTQHTNSTFDTFAQEKEWGDDDDVPDDESIVSIDINDIKDLLTLSSYRVPDDESIVSFDINDIKNDLIHLSSDNQAQEWGDDDDVPDEESIVPTDINDVENDLIPLSRYNEDAVDEALKWTEAFMDHDDDSDEESIEAAPLHDSMSSFNHGFVKLTSCMARSALTRQELARQYSEKSLGSSKSTTIDISQHSFNHNDSLQLQCPLGPSSSSHSTSSGLAKPRIKKAQGLRSGLIRRHSHRSLSAQDITKRGLVKKDSLASLNGSLNSISLHGNSTWKSLSRSSSFRKTKLSQETMRSLMDSSTLSLQVKARMSQKVNQKQRMLDQLFVVAAPRVQPKPNNKYMVQRLSQSMSSVVT
jgi:hypothetical protein